MAFLQITIDLGAADPAPLEDLLFGLGSLSVTLEDAADDPVLEPAPGATPLWPRVRLRALFPAGTDRSQISEALRTCVPGRDDYRFEQIEDRAWEREWLKDFRPMRFGHRLWVCPGGMEAGDADAVRVVLDPGLAFGTGTHPTTALCLEWLDAQPLHGRRVVDYGCGSGILAIAAARLGAAAIRATDIDPQALTATRDNAARNAVGALIDVTADTELDTASADVLLANILAGPLVELAPRFAAAVCPGGLLALSGLLTGQVATVTAAYRPWFDIDTAATREGWALLAGRRRAD